MTNKFPYRGLYAVIDSIAHERYGLNKLLHNIVLHSNIPVIQFRLKTMSMIDKQNLLLNTLELKKERDFCIIINDDIELLNLNIPQSRPVAKLARRSLGEGGSQSQYTELTVNGLHLGQQDIAFAMAQKAYPNKIMGLSTHDLKQAQAAQEMQANYIGIGAVFPTTTKQNSALLGLEAVQNIASQIQITKVAIGGIKLDNIESVAATGCEMAAVISGLVVDGEFIGQKLHENFLK